MIQRLLVSLLTLAVFVSTTPWEAIAFSGGPEHSTIVSSSRSSSRSTPAQRADTCPEGCLCACCPGHTLPPPPRGNFAFVCLIADQNHPVLSERVHLREIAERIFHPPQFV
jgi:hypothetical protein